MRKKWMAAAMIAGLTLVAVLAGCSGNNGESGGKPSPTSESNGQTTPTEETRVRHKITSSIYDRGSVPAAEGTVEKNRWTKWLSENGPHDVSFVAIPRWESDQKFNTLMASGSAPDLLFEYAPAIRSVWYEQKQLLPLDDLIEEHSTAYKELLEKYPALRKAGTLSDGKLYYMGRLNEVYPQRAILIRKDWLDELQLNVPGTTEQLFALAKAFAEQDPDRNGQKDTYGMAISGSGAERTIKQMFQSVDFIVRDGKVEYPWDNIAETASFLKRLYDEGIVDKDFLTDNNGEKAKQDFVNGKIGIYPTQVNWTSFAQNEYKTLKENVPGAELMVIPLPASPAGAFVPTLTNPVQMTAAVNRAAKNPQAVIEFADFLVEPSTGKTLVFGFEGEHHEVGANGCPTIVDGDQKQQIGYMSDMTMLTSSPYVLNGTCGIETQFDLSNSYGQDVLELFKQAKQTYLDLSRPYPELTISEHMPQMPKDLQVTMNETYKTVGDLFQKALVGGADYSVEQMLKDAQGVWAKGKGPDAEVWINKWYAEESDNAFMPDDLFEIVRQQEGL